MSSSTAARKFLCRALKRELAGRQETVVYAQGPHQRVIVATHYRSSQADEWVSKKQINTGHSSRQGAGQGRAGGLAHTGHSGSCVLAGTS